MLARHSTLADVFLDWEAAHLARGGDRQVTVRLGSSQRLTDHSSSQGKAGGTVTLDLLGGTVRAELTGLSEPLDLWLVDNRPGGGRSALPEPGDRRVRLGRLAPAPPGTAATLDRELGPDFFDRFDVDLAVATVAGEPPFIEAPLFGGRGYFERLHTRLRKAGDRQRSRLLEALTPLTPTRILGDAAAMLSPRPAEAQPPNPLVASGLMSQQVADGADLFFRETFDGNGRTCGTCHRVTTNLGIDADLIASLPLDDPLFVAERPAEEGGVPGLEIPELLRGFELILENVDGLEDPRNKLTMRGVPHIQSMITSIEPPANDGRAALARTGWSGDGAPMTGELRFFALGAIRQHFPRTLARVEGQDFRFPTDEELDALEAYMLSVGRLVNTRITSMIFEDPRAALGREVFLTTGKCFECHVNLGAFNAFGGNRNFETGIERIPHPARAVVDFPPDGGFGTDPVDDDGDGIPDRFGDGTFNTPPLVEAADTAPFFHNNLFPTLEEAVAFYDSEEFNASPGADFVGGIDITEEEIEGLTAFLRVVNAAFNLEIAVQRITAAQALRPAELVAVRAGETGGPPAGQGPEEIGRTLLRLAAIELVDAVEVLTEGDLHPDAVALALDATLRVELALAARAPRERDELLLQATELLEDARLSMGQGLAFLLGEGNLAF